MLNHPLFSLRWGGVDDPACVECYAPKSFHSGALIEGALPRLLAYIHVHVHVHLHESPLAPISCQSPRSARLLARFTLSAVPHRLNRARHFLLRGVLFLRRFSGGRFPVLQGGFHLLLQLHRGLLDVRGPQSAQVVGRLQPLDRKSVV